MAAGLMPRSPRRVAGPLGGLVLALALAGCGSGITAGGLGATPPDAATPLIAPTTAMAATLAALEAALASGGYDIGVPGQLYRPTEPASFVRVPRIEYRVNLADPSDGVLLIYEFTDAAGAAAGAQTLAGYLASGNGQTTFPGDTVFSVSYLGPTVTLSWFSAARSDDPLAGRGAFNLIAMVGTPVRVIK
ncbi:MAG: hypothetical protein ACRDF7_06830 [Candidatus Limnocylindrales bacterium]